MPNSSDPVTETSPPFLELCPRRNPNSEIRRLAAYILNKYSNQELSASKYQKARDLTMTKRIQGTPVSAPFKFDDVLDMMVSDGALDTERLGWLRLGWRYLDADAELNMSLPQAMVGADGVSVKFNLNLQMGDRFPLHLT